MQTDVYRSACLSLFIGIIFAPTFAFSQGGGTRGKQKTSNTYTRMQADIDKRGGAFKVGSSSATRRSLRALTGYLPEKDERKEIEKSNRRNKRRPKSKGKAKASPMSALAKQKRFDWRTENVVTPIKDQQQCGSCVLFAVSGALESSIAMQTGKTLDLSEQRSLNCSIQNICKSGSMISGRAGFLRDHGTYTEAKMPYEASKKKCDKRKTGDFYLGAWGYVRHGLFDKPSVAEIKDALVLRGPLVTSMHVDSEFQAYQSGVYSAKKKYIGTNHAVVIVGWDDDKGAWIVRNSWGLDGRDPWGTNCDFGQTDGYAYVKFGTANIGKTVVWVQAKSKATIGKTKVCPSGSFATIGRWHKCACNGGVKRYTHLGLKAYCDGGQDQVTCPWGEFKESGKYKGCTCPKNTSMKKLAAGLGKAYCTGAGAPMCPSGTFETKVHRGCRCAKGKAFKAGLTGKASCKTVKCTNKSAKYVSLPDGGFECRHTSKFHTVSCPSGYAYRAGKCYQADKPKKTKCPLLQHRCAQSGRDVCYTKKNCKGKRKSSVTCSKNQNLKIDHSGRTDQCVGEKKKNQTVKRCPVGWLKGVLITKGSNGFKKYSCKTIRL